MKLKFTTILVFLITIVVLSTLCISASDPDTAVNPQTLTQQQPTEAHEEHSSHASGHGDPYAAVFEVFAILLLCAVVGRYAAKKLKQSPVLGELIIGIIGGAVIYHLGGPALTIIRHYDVVQNVTHRVLHENKGWEESVQATLSDTELSAGRQEKIRRVLLGDNFPQYFTLARSMLLFSSLGVILLLFMVGLECSVEEMKEVGGSASGVAAIGVVAPFVLGYYATVLLLPGGNPCHIKILHKISPIILSTGHFAATSIYLALIKKIQLYNLLAKIFNLRAL